jgi:hypothetical protein
MRTGWRTALVVVLGVAAAPSARPVNVHAQAAPVGSSQEVNQTVDVAEAPVAPRVRGFNTAQLVEWVNEDGTPQQSKPEVNCPISPAEPGTSTKFGCAVAIMRESGSKLHRLVVFWSDLQPNNASEFEGGWKKYQAVIDALANAGITQLIVTPVGSPNWARHPDRHSPVMAGFAKYAHPDLDHVEDWKNFVEQLARHVAPVGFEIGNEENTNNFWDAIKNDRHTPEDPSPAEYGQLYCAAVEGISRVSPTARIGIGGLAQIHKTVLNGPGDERIKASEFLSRSMTEGGVGKGACRLNFVGYHPYLTNDYCTSKPPRPPIGNTVGIAELRDVHDFMVRKRLHQKIWITEWGFPSRPYTRGKQTCRYSAADQARLIKLEHEYLARLPYTAFSGYFNLVDDTSTGQNGPIGLVCLDFTLKRSFNTWRQLRPAAPGGPLTTGVCPRPSPPPPTL